MLKAVGEQAVGNSVGRLPFVVSRCMFTYCESQELAPSHRAGTSITSTFIGIEELSVYECKIYTMRQDNLVKDRHHRGHSTVVTVL